MADADKFDLAVIGAGPGGQSAAIQAAKAGRRVLAVDRHKTAGGAGPDDRRDRYAARDCKSWRSGPIRMGVFRVHARIDDHYADRRQTFGHLQSPLDLPHGNCGVYGRFGAVRRG